MLKKVLILSLVMAFSSFLLAEVQAVRVGGDIRVRGVMWKNLWSFDNDYRTDIRDFYRHRTNIWVSADLTDNINAFVKLNNEYHWGNYASTHSVFNNDIVIDNAYIELGEFMTWPMSLKIGRQNLIFGEGFMILEGTPKDGSKTIGFDAIRATWKLDENTLDVFTAKLSEGYGQHTDEDLYGVYLTNTYFPTKIEVYVLRRERRASETFSGGSTYADKIHPKQTTDALGVRLSGKLGENFSYSAEIAQEWGRMKREAGDGIEPKVYRTKWVRKEATGGYVRGTYTFADVAFKPAVTLEYVYLSGDNPDSKKYEGWDQFYSEFPKYSELYVYSMWDGFNAVNGSIDQDLETWTNMTMSRIGMKIHFTDKLSFEFNYKDFRALQDTNLTAYENPGKHRGENLQAWIRYRYSEDVSFHILWEQFDPGNYYPEDNRDKAYFSRFEVLVKF
ncbi:hypothetical protein J7K56_02140 [Candidatus Calescamantes bacterium]|nr:hypothetical protein [Candidatus Calescamantes bacterium]